MLALAFVFCSSDGNKTENFTSVLNAFTASIVVCYMEIRLIHVYYLSNHNDVSLYAKNISRNAETP